MLKMDVDSQNDGSSPHVLSRRVPRGSLTIMPTSISDGRLMLMGIPTECAEKIKLRISNEKNNPHDAMFIRRLH